MSDHVASMETIEKMLGSGPLGMAERYLLDRNDVPVGDRLVASDLIIDEQQSKKRMQCHLDMILSCFDLVPIVPKDEGLGTVAARDMLADLGDGTEDSNERARAVVDGDNDLSQDHRVEKPNMVVEGNDVIEGIKEDTPSGGIRQNN